MSDYSVTLKSNKTLEVQGSLHTVAELDALIVVLSGMREVAFQGVTIDAVTDAGHDGQLYDVVLTKTGDRKIEVIKAIRTLNGMGLLQAKNMAESNRYETVLRSVSHSGAQEARRLFNSVGATVEFRRT